MRKREISSNLKREDNLSVEFDCGSRKIQSVGACRDAVVLALFPVGYLLAIAVL